MRKPNLIYILADDMGYGDISALNEHCGFKTPNLDEMAENGVCFTDAHATAAVCTPSRYGILTGRYNWRSRLKSSVMGGYSEALIEKGRKTLADMLKENGYRTAMVGKWHLGMNFAKEEGFVEKPDFGVCDHVDYHGKIEGSPISNGFEYFYGISGSLDMPPYIYIENDHFTAQPDHVTKGTGKGFFREGPTAPGFVHEKVLDELTEKVLEKMEEYREEPFFLYFPMPAPHTPILPASQFCGKSGTNEYGDFVLHCDDVAGRINRKLKELGLYENTMIIFTSDHGEYMGFHHMMLKCNYLYDPLAKIPLLVKYPGQKDAGRTESALSENIDVAPTVLEACGVKAPASMQGKSLLTGGGREFVFSEGQYGTEEEPRIGYMLRTKRYKLLVQGSMENTMLFDLEKDPEELENVAEDPAYGEILAGLQRRLADFVLFHSTGKVYRNRQEPQLRKQEELDAQAERMKQFIRERW